MGDLAVLGQISETSLTRDVAIAYEQSGLPNTFVPGRNLLFLTFAATIAYRRGLEVLVGGMCETDFSGYPDCRDNTMKAMQLALSLGSTANCASKPRSCGSTRHRPGRWLISSVAAPSLT